MKRGQFIGMDLGDQSHEICGLDEQGDVVERQRIANTQDRLKKVFTRQTKATVAIEAGTHSGWIARLLESLGHKVVVAQPRAVRAIWDRDRKNDTSDAELLARLLRADPRLLHPIRVRGEDAQIDMLMLKTRDGLVRTRTKLINQARGLAKSLGHRFASSDAGSFVPKARAAMPSTMAEALNPLLITLDTLELQIRALDRRIEELAQNRYPETTRLRQVTGVGALTSLAYVLNMDDPHRFEHSRDVGPFLGLTPRQDQSGATDKQLRITKAGDSYVRRLLVGSAQYILGPFGPPCTLRDFGMRLSRRGGRNAKRRAVVAVARKLAVLLHALWVNPATPYDPARGGVQVATSV